MATRDILNWQGNVIGSLTLPDNTSEAQWGAVLSPYAINPSTICQPVTARQMRQALFMMGVSASQIDSAIAGLPDPTKTVAQIQWEYSNDFLRDNPMVAMVGQMLSWTSSQLDSLWHLAATL